MIRCWFCGRWFKNKRSLEAHLRWCDVRKRGEIARFNPYLYYKPEKVRRLG